MRATYAGRQLPEIWIRQKTLEQGSPVTTEQFMQQYRRSREDAERLLANLERERRVRKITGDGGILIGWRSRNAS